MVQRKNNKQKKKKAQKTKKITLKKKSSMNFSLPEETKKYIFGIGFFLSATIFILSFFGMAGPAGDFLFKTFSFLVGEIVFAILALFLCLAGIAFFRTEYKKIFKPIILFIGISTIGVAGILECLNLGVKKGGWLGYIITWPLLKLFDLWVTRIIFVVAIIVGGLIFWRLIISHQLKKEEQEKQKEKPLINRLVRKIIKGTPSFKTDRIEKKPIVFEKEIKPVKEATLKAKVELADLNSSEKQYERPPIELLDSVKGQPFGGDIRMNSMIIKKTLESFDIPVEMSNVVVGPTVTQYSLKPADGIKLSKITALSNDLALSLATHPIRIEAPIPGKSLVGIEIPNKKRTFVRLKELMQGQKFQDSFSHLILCLGKDVSGDSIYANLEKMPHLLVAGSTGTGKTIFLNSLILSLLYNNSPETMRLILIDPKRVEFNVYEEIPHLLCPTIVDAQRAVNALKWLTEEMERRFKLLAEVKSRNIISYNEKIMSAGEERLPYIVLIVDELADLMAAKGRDIETGIVRIAQMARAVGIHLVIATQRPSVEVITGLIKANITSRATFQVASQIDSRTVLDTSGAEKLLGLGDMLFISNEIIKPKRIQGAYASDKEVKRVVKWISENKTSLGQTSNIGGEALKEDLTTYLEKSLEVSEGVGPNENSFQEDPLYDEAKRVIIENKRASSSLLQRKLRVGYARAARLIDMLEDQGIVGPSRGSKPREIYISNAGENYIDKTKEDDDDGWQSV